MRTAEATAPMAFFPFSWMHLPRGGCANIRRRETRWIKMVAPEFVAVNRNEYENRALSQDYDRISSRVVSHKWHSFQLNRFRHFPKISSRWDACPQRPTPLLQDHSPHAHKVNCTSN